MTTFVNNAKTVMLLGALTALLVGVGAMIGQNFILPFLIFAIVMNVGVWFFSDKIAIATMRGQQVDESHPLYRMVDRLRQRAGLPMPRVFVCPQQAPNAFATGRNPRHAAVAVTQGALQLLEEQELEGVMAHELAHVKNRDTLTSTIAAVIAGVLASIAHWGFFLGAGRDREGGNPLLVIATIILAPIAAALIKAAISRSREYVADAHGAQIAGSPRGLMSALHKLEVYAGRIPLDQPNPAMNNMFIIEPAMSMRGMVNMFATHPPTEKRIAALAQLG
jgi:heat shock protein HtpX